MRAGAIVAADIICIASCKALTLIVFQPRQPAITRVLISPLYSKQKIQASRAHKAGGVCVCVCV